MSLTNTAESRAEVMAASSPRSRAASPAAASRAASVVLQVTCNTSEHGQKLQHAGCGSLPLTFERFALLSGLPCYCRDVLPPAPEGIASPAQTALPPVPQSAGRAVRPLPLPVCPGQL
jgi:hypothetical protein